MKKVLKEFDNTLFAQQGGSCFECCDYKAMYDDLKEFMKKNFVTREEMFEFIEYCDKLGGWNHSLNDWLRRKRNEN